MLASDHHADISEPTMKHETVCLSLGDLDIAENVTE